MCESRPLANASLDVALLVGWAATFSQPLAFPSAALGWHLGQALATTGADVGLWAILGRYASDERVSPANASRLTRSSATP